MASRRPMRRSSSSTACCWAALENEPAGWTQAPSQADFGVRASSAAGPEGGKARADMVRAPTRPASRSRAVTTREGGRREVTRVWRGGGADQAGEQGGGGEGGGGGGGGGDGGVAGGGARSRTGDVTGGVTP